jgi:hypothetical protein
LYNEFIRYFLLLILVFILGNVISKIKPCISTFFSYIWVKGILIFFSLIILIYDIDREINYKNILIIFIVTILFTIMCYYLVLSSEKDIEESKIKKLKKGYKILKLNTIYKVY